VSQRTRSVSGGRKSLADQRHDLVGLRIATEHRLREYELAVHVHVEDAVRPRDDLDDADDVLPLLEDARRQTGSVGPRPSRDAVLDPDVMALDHRFDSTTRRPPPSPHQGEAHAAGAPAAPIPRTRRPTDYPGRPQRRSRRDPPRSRSPLVETSRGEGPCAVGRFGLLEPSRCEGLSESLANPLAWSDQAGTGRYVLPDPGVAVCGNLRHAHADSVALSPSCPGRRGAHSASVNGSALS
jgi:hypothetical protein